MTDTTHEAPERIYLDGDVEAGDGMFPRCFEDPKYASEPQVEYVRADLVQAAVLALMGYDAKGAGAKDAGEGFDLAIRMALAAIRKGEQ